MINKIPSKRFLSSHKTQKLWGCNRRRQFQPPRRQAWAAVLYQLARNKAPAWMGCVEFAQPTAPAPDTRRAISGLAACMAPFSGQISPWALAVERALSAAPSILHWPPTAAFSTLSAASLINNSLHGSLKLHIEFEFESTVCICVRLW